MNEIPYGFIYITTCLVNKKRYIGQSTYSRTNWHNYLGSGRTFRLALKKYGRKSFKRIIICEAYSKEELAELEVYFIKIYNAVNNNNFYNMKDDFGWASYGFLGKKHTPERNFALSQKMMGHKVSEETREKMRNRHPTTKMRENMRKIASNQTGGNHPRAREVTIDGITYLTLTEAMKATGLNLRAVRKLAKPPTINQACLPK